MFIGTHRELCEALIKSIEGKSSEQILAERERRGSEVRFISKLVNTYHRAERNAAKFGFIGVGAISFAQSRMIEFQRRVGRA